MAQQTFGNSVKFRGTVNRGLGGGGGGGWEGGFLIS